MRWGDILAGFRPFRLGKPRSEALFVPLVPWTLIPIWVRVWVRIRENPKVIFPLEWAFGKADGAQNLPRINKEKLLYFLIYCLVTIVEICIRSLLKEIRMIKLSKWKPLRLLMYKMNSTFFKMLVHL